MIGEDNNIVMTAKSDREANQLRNSYDKVR